MITLSGTVYILIKVVQYIVSILIAYHVSTSSYQFLIENSGVNVISNFNKRLNIIKNKYSQNKDL